MSVEDDKKALARYRLEQADECLDEAKFLLSGEKSARSVINRSYYAMFYAVLALLVYEPFSSSKHSGILAYFNQHFIKVGVFDMAMGRWINKAFELRQRSDYREYFEPTQDQAADLMVKAEQFVSVVQSYVDVK